MSLMTGSIQVADAAALEETLRPRAHVRALLDAASDGIYSADAAGVCHYANLAAASLLGYEVADLIGAHLHPLIHHTRLDGSPFPAEECPDHVATVEMRPVDQDDDEAVFWRADGTMLHVERRSQPVVLDGRVVGVLTKFTDVTGRQDAAAELGGLLATTADAFIGLDSASRIIGWNTAARELIGWMPSDVLGLHVGDVIAPPHLRAAYYQNYDHLDVLDDAALPLGPFESTVLRKDGAEVEVDITVGRVGPAGRRRYHMFMRDLTARRQAEQALARSEAMHRLLAENSHDVLSQLGADGRIRYVSPAVQSVLGIHPDELVGSQALDLVHPDDAVGLVDAEGHFFVDAGHRELTFRVRHREGHWVWVEAVSSVLRDAKGQITEVQMCTRDITDRKARDEEIHQESKLESLGRLSAGLAHEINTPIQYVGDNARFLAEAFSDLMDMVTLYRGLLDRAEPMEWAERQEQMREAENRLEVDYLQSEVPSAVEQTLQGIERVATIVRAMKTFSHPGHKELVPADLNEALMATVTVARHQVTRVADLELDLDELPPVRCNIPELNQVFLNLIVNAADAVEETGRRGTVTISSRVQGPNVQIMVSDTGAGMPEHVQAKIFDPFFTTKEVGRGTGQGLPLVRSVIQDQHGGTLSVRTKQGAGTTFAIRLPIAGPPAATAVTPSR
jgi:PAS domain S-box-containing protein